MACMDAAYPDHLVRTPEPEPTPEEAAATDDGAATRLWVERTGPGTFRGRSSRGGVVDMARTDTRDAFTPGELLKLSLAGCAAMSADATLRRRLGDDFASTVRVVGTSDRDEERYPLLEEVFELDLAHLTEAEREQIVTIARRAIDRACTVGRTLTHGAEVDLHIDPAAGSDRIDR